ncbi:hypothetical protein [Streptomyces sp. NPDC059071]|uniref:hypothetical protein n=1 Tax=unclassified Streptomyces TaxID=2593676 RepID=UPI00365E22E3
MPRNRRPLLAAAVSVARGKLAKPGGFQPMRPPGGHEVENVAKTYRVRWTQDGQERESQVGYDQPSAEQRKKRLEEEGVTDVEIVPAAP